jgi:hypothetical protein
MKKIFFAFLALGVTFSTFAQEAADKKVQAGLTGSFGMNFQKMGTKRMTTDGVGIDLTVGANATFNFTETIGLCTGLEFDFETLKYKATNYESIHTYYYYNDTEILSQTDAASDANAKLFMLDSREQKAVYLTVPTMLIFRTKFFGYMRYFGKFGLRNSFLLTNKINDTGYNFPIAQSFIEPKVAGVNENMKAPGDMFFFKSAFGLCGGAEWNFSGSTSLVGEIGYYYGFTPLHTNKNTDKGNNFLFATDENNGSGNDKPFNNAATQSQLMLKVSILF